jgi:hypothetical protein
VPDGGAAGLVQAMTTIERLLGAADQAPPVAALPRNKKSGAKPVRGGAR